ncbi:MAG TPA: sulfotransferase [Bryobacteraceae bacterium]|nr:sulfotransferase [Bryobacteraceae bacterium]
MGSSTTAAPIFIVGSPRSGTTLIRQLLDRHPSIAICDETHFLPLVYARRKAFGDLAVESNRRRLISEYLVNRHFKRASLNAPELAERLSREAISYQAMFTSILTYYADLQGKRRIGEKSPQHALHLETLREWFRDSLIIHMVRDPRACVASMLHKPWSRGSALGNALRWMKLSQAARKFRGQPGYLEVRYEALVTDPDGELRKVCAFVNEEYSPLMLAAEGSFSTDGRTRDRARRSVSSERLGVWRQELSEAQVAQIEWALGPNLESFGYAREASPASALTVLRGLGGAAFGFARYLMPRLPAACYRFAAPAKLAKYDHWTGPRIWSEDSKQTRKEA